MMIPSGGMFKLRQQFITPEKKLNKKALIAEVRRELETFTQALDLYLSTCVHGKDFHRSFASDPGDCAGLCDQFQLYGYGQDLWCAGGSYFLCKRAGWQRTAEPGSGESG